MSENGQMIAALEEPDVTVMQDMHNDDYVFGTLANLSKLYWHLHVFDLDDIIAIDNYLMINECEIYTDYYHDDFEWKEIREATRDFIAKNMDTTFPHQFKFMLPIDLSRYDPERGGFELVNQTGFNNSRRLEITGNSVQKRVCEHVGAIQDYPRNLIMVLDKPLTFNFIEVDDHVAQAYIIRRKYAVEALPEEQRMRAYERTAYVRIRATFHDYQGSVLGMQSEPLSILYASIDGIDVFEDLEETMLLSSVNFDE